MKKYLLSLLVCVGMLLITCGNEPPEGFYNGTPEDDSLIQSQLSTHPELTNTIDQFIADYIPVDPGALVYPVADSYFKADSPLIKVVIDSCGLSFSDSSRFTDLWYAKDTTCTVYLWDTFTVISLVHIATKYIAHYDMAVIDTTIDPQTGDTTFDTIAYAIGTIDTVIPAGVDAYPEKNIEGEGKRLIFLEPKRDTTVDENGDTIYPVAEPHEWIIKRISYGVYYYPNRGADVPIIDQIVLYNQTTGKSDTILSSSYDTTYTGHAMNRLRSIDSLLEYSSGDTIQIGIAINYTQVPEDFLYFASINGSRVQLLDGTGNIVITGSDIENLYIEAVFKDSYFYANPDKGYNAVVWLIPVKID